MNTDTQATDYRRIAQAINYIVNSFPHKPDLKDIAAQVHLSEFHFQRLFSKWAGISPKKFQQFLTLSFAKECLNEDFSIEAASLESGLSGSGRLHDLFVNLEGVTPGEYKSKGQGVTIRYGTHESPFGTVFIAMTHKGICRMVFTDSPAAEVDSLKKEWSAAEILLDQHHTSKTFLQIFSENPSPLSVHIKGTPFQLKVWEALLKIPEGKLVSYGVIAEAIGKPTSSRAVGTAIGQNPIAYLIPCHRVIRQSGHLGGYRWGLTRKQAMIGWEAARVKT
jgi:AraC family transcriptional regulator of adaptative response/methylated-DNA-[protein]-cysteine methyltransferase